MIYLDAIRLNLDGFRFVISRCGTIKYGPSIDLRYEQHNFSQKERIALDIVVLRDLIKDERGNYYVALQINGNELTLVNAFVELSFRTILLFNDKFRDKYANYEHQFMGKIAMDDLRHQYVDLINKKGAGHIYSLEEAGQAFRLIFIDTIEFYRNPKLFTKKE
jgi:hypothetical protein